MPRLSKLIERLEDHIEKKCAGWPQHLNEIYGRWFALFTPHGLLFTAVIVLLICLITKKGYIWFSGYKFIRDPRGFDILRMAPTEPAASLRKRRCAPSWRWEAQKRCPA